MIKEGLKIHGSMRLTIERPNGEVEVRAVDNAILRDGFDFIADAIGNSTRPAAMGWIAVGTGTTAVATTQTALITELTRQAAPYSHTNDTQTFKFTTTFAAGVATGAITEAGVVNAASAGVFLDRVLFNVVNKGADDVMTVEFQFTLT